MAKVCGGDDNSHGRSLDPVIPMEVDRGLDPNPKFARGLSVLAHRIHGVPTGKAPTTTLRLSLAPGRTGISCGNNVVRQRVLFGYSFNNEKRSDDLPKPSSHYGTDPKITGCGETTNLSLSEDG